MYERKVAQGIGWLSVAAGVSFALAPARTASSFGMGERRKLGRFLGARDLVIGTGLLRSENPRTWLLARAVSDAQDAALLVGGAASGAFPRKKALFGLAVAAGLSAASFVLSQRLD